MFLETSFSFVGFLLSKTLAPPAPRTAGTAAVTAIAVDDGATIAATAEDDVDTAGMVDGDTVSVAVGICCVAPTILPLPAVAPHAAPAAATRAAAATLSAALALSAAATAAAAALAAALAAA